MRASEDQGIRAAKISEIIGLGVPTVSYDYEVTSDLRETRRRRARQHGGGVRRGARPAAEDEARRASLAEAARRAGRELDWDVLADRFERDVLEVFLPRS